MKKKKAVILTMWDLKTFFDTENLVDCMNELYKSEIKGKTYRLLFKLNENIRISVKTPVGSTEFKDTSMGVGQGTTEGANISAASIDHGVTEEFGEPEKEQDEEKEANGCPKPMLY